MPPKFDMQKARDLLKAYAPGFARPCEIEALDAALDEIERLLSQVDHLISRSHGQEELICDQQDAIATRAKRIAELEGNHCADCCCARSWEALGIAEYTGRSIPEEITRLKADLVASNHRYLDLQHVCDDQEKISIKQRAALKKLGASKRARGKALVGERARGNYFDESKNCEGYWWDRKNTDDCTQNQYREVARGQLRQEGKL